MFSGWTCPVLGFRKCICLSFPGKGRLFSGMSIYMVPAGLGCIAALSGNSIGHVNIFESLPGNTYAHP